MILKRPLIIFDLETTGLNIANDRIVEIGALIINPDNSTELYQTYINPEVDIPKQASDIHGITNDMVKDSPTFKDVSKELFDIFDNADLGGYNSNMFDVPFLVSEFKRAGLLYNISNRALIDACYIFKKKERRNLEGAYKFYCNAKLENSHSAVADLKATWLVLQEQIKRYDDLSFDVNVLHRASNDEATIDLAGRMKMDMEGFACMNFGKYKGQRICDLVLTNPDYFDWMLSSDFTDDTKNHLKSILNELKNEI
jgi:DNA polymerase-3 subunit epsilon